MGRSDDMLIIRGVNVFPSQIETVLLKEGYEPNYQIIVDRVKNNDTFDVNVEMTPEMFTDKVSDIMKSFRGKLWFVKMGLKLKKKMNAGKKDGEKKSGGFDVDLKSGDGLMQMMGGFTVLRLTSMMGMMNVNFTKEELLKLNKQLNRIRKPKNLNK
jgi:hypothetical protein